ncbi:MAG: hypothetical protein CFE37_05140 [Alphaproteobacteria bacterium PA4]|nr:MAG: hypothetical protein CFE37_05140 [Alphaproteobacteria bacterium PA4]
MRPCLFALLLTSVAPALAVQPFTVTYESEGPGLQRTSARLFHTGIEDFDSRAVGRGRSWTTDFGTGGAITGRYSNVQILDRDQYGGAGGTGRYAVAFGHNPFTLDLATSLAGGVNYFGYWLSALDRGNRVTFYSGGKQSFVFNADQALDMVRRQPNPWQYYGNPNAPFRGRNGWEPYLFVNFFADSGQFDRIEFSEVPAVGGYESDNHTVGRFLSKGTGTLITGTASVPEPASWAMLIAGFGLVGTMMRRRARVVA